MRWLVIGSAGMLGRDVVTALGEGGHVVTAATRHDLDITDARACVDAAADHDVVVNCAAYTAVDDAETAEPDAFTVNAVGAANVARGARAAGARVVQISTDYVFDGHADTPWLAGAPMAPRSAYGRTKAAGEWAVRAENPDHLVVRTAWLYGAHGRCFPTTIAGLVRDRGTVSVVDDQVGQPTWTADVARIVLDLVERQAPAGTYHATSSGQASWFDFARAAVGSAGLDPQVVGPTTTDAFPRPAPRPAYSVLDHDTLRAAGVEPIGAWDERWAVAAPVVMGTATNA